MNTTHQQNPANNADEIHRNVKSQVRVGIALVIFTTLAVGLSFIPFHSQSARILAVVTVAAVNALLVSFFSMHLKAERNIIGRFVFFTVIFVIGLFALTALAYLDSTRLH